MEWFWTDVAFFGLWKFINVVALFCIYVPAPLWFAADALRLFRPWGQRISLEEMILPTIVFVSWIMIFALYHDPEPSRHSYTSIDGSKHYRIKDTFENNTSASFSDYVAYKRREQPIPVTKTLIRSEIRQFELLDWTNPKHVYVELRDVKSNLVYDRIYVSKHCNEARSFQAHDTYNLSVDIVTYSDAPNEKRLVFNNLYNAFCGG